jgi:hypothetical protein
MTSSASLVMAPSSARHVCALHSSGQQWLPVQTRELFGHLTRPSVKKTFLSLSVIVLNYGFAGSKWKSFLSAVSERILLPTWRILKPKRTRTWRCTRQQRLRETNKEKKKRKERRWEEGTEKENEWTFNIWSFRGDEGFDFGPLVVKPQSLVYGFRRFGGKFCLRVKNVDGHNP